MKGKLPAWLSGAFVRNGPGTFKGVKCEPCLPNETPETCQTQAARKALAHMHPYGKHMLTLHAWVMST